MKKFCIIGVVFSGLVLVAALINQFHYRPLAKNLRLFAENGIAESRKWIEAHDFSVMLGEIVLVAGLVTFIFCIVPVIRMRSKPAFAGVMFSIASVMLGLMQGTHMFA